MKNGMDSHEIEIFRGCFLYWEKISGLSHRRALFRNQIDIPRGITCVISLLVADLYNIVDQIFIANTDYRRSFGNAANTVAIAAMIGDGCCTFVSIRLRAKEKDNAKRGIGSSVINVVAVGPALMAKETQADGSIIIEIKKQYNTSPVGNYLD